MTDPWLYNKDISNRLYNLLLKKDWLPYISTVIVQAVALASPWATKTSKLHKLIYVQHYEKYNLPQKQQGSYTSHQHINMTSFQASILDFQFDLCWPDIT